MFSTLTPRHGLPTSVQRAGRHRVLVGSVFTLTIVAVASSACGKSQKNPTNVPAHDLPAPVPRSKNVAASIGSATTTPTAGGVQSAVAPTASVILRLPSAGALEIENATQAPVSIAWHIAIERQTHGAWLTNHAMSMSDKCPLTYPEPDCKILAAGEHWRPLPWTGWIGCTQCNMCDKNYPIAAGTYRFAISECNSSTRFVSEPIVIDSPAHFAGTPCDAACRALEKSFRGK